MIKALDIGCGGDKIRLRNAQVIGLDINKGSQADVIHNLEKMPLPFKKDTFDFIHAAQIFEHINNLIPLVKDVHRVAKKGAKIRIEVPYFASSKAVTDPTHVRSFAYGSFDHFYGNMFKIKSKKIWFSKRPAKFVFLFNILNFLITPLINLNSTTAHYYNRFLCFIIPCEDIEFELEVIK